VIAISAAIQPPIELPSTVTSLSSSSSSGEAERGEAGDVSEHVRSRRAVEPGMGRHGHARASALVGGELLGKAAYGERTAAAVQREGRTAFAGIGDGNVDGTDLRKPHGDIAVVLLVVMGFSVCARWMV
jgi:hypothetical protein